MRWQRSLLILAIAGTALVGLSFAQNAPATPKDIAPYLKAQNIVTIAEGRTINLVCLGKGSPTVVLTAGLGGWSWVWYQVQPSLSHRARVCTWDPAGLGFSRSSPEPQDAIHESEDLAEALKGAHVDGPYVMVAHSAGAYVALRFADQYPGNVVGIVFVDPAIPDQDAVRERVAPKFAAFGAAAPKADAMRLRRCAADIQSGALKPGTSEFDSCTAPFLLGPFSSLTKTIAGLNADPARLLTQASAVENAVAQSGREAVNPKRSYGDMPLIVLTAGSHPIPPDVPADVREQATLYFRALASGHEAYAALSTRGYHQLVPDSAHFIQIDHPKIVVDAITRVLAEIGSQKRSTN